MEQLDKALQREQLRLSRDILKPVDVRSLSDIKRVISEFDPSNNKQQTEIPITAILNESEGGKPLMYSVSSSTKSKSKRDILIEGLELIKNRIDAAQKISDSTEEVEINGRKLRPPSLINNISGHSWVDPLIKQWTGGRREGVLITWDIQDGYQYRYEIFTHKLTRISRTREDSTASVGIS
jgi:hypothetical protein